MKPISAQGPTSAQGLFKIEEVGGKLLITFKGGIEVIVDAIIGADGIQGICLEAYTGRAILLRRQCLEHLPHRGDFCQ